MKKLFALFSVLTLLVGFFAGCTATEDTESTADTVAMIPVDIPQNTADMFTDRDSETDYDESNAVSIMLNGTSATASSDSVLISGSTVTITEEATYLISGQLSGMLVVNTPDTAKPHLIFNNVSITGDTSAALYILEADKVFLTLADGSDNTLANGGSFTAIDDNNIDGALFSKQDLTINGTGALTVTSPAGHGIVCKDDLVITGGTYQVNAASHGLDANDSIRFTGANLTVDAGKDALHAENTDDTALGFIYIAGGTIRAEAEGDGIAASAYLQVAEGTIDLLVGGGSENGEKEHSDGFGNFMGGGPGGMRPGQQQTTITTTENSTSMKGLKAASSMLISGGSITVNSADDALHSDVSLTISGGSFTLASGDDAIHAENTLTVTGGTIDISESYEGLEALHIRIEGGEIALKASDDGLNAAGGTDQSGTTGGRDGAFGGGRPGMGGGMGGPGGMSAGNGSIIISGGKLSVQASGDGIDANGTLEISGGYTVVTGPTQGDTATLDYDKSAVISGGTFIGTGGAGMAQSFSDSTQGVMALNVGNLAAGTEILLKDAGGNVIISHKPELSFAVVILSDPQITKGETYTVCIGAETAEITAD